jgi:hypothetical protein
MFQLKCVACIVEAKIAGKTLVEVRDAVAIVQAQTTCAEHIVIQQESQISAPDGSRIVRAVR